MLTSAYASGPHAVSVAWHYLGLAIYPSLPLIEGCGEALSLFGTRDEKRINSLQG